MTLNYLGAEHGWRQIELASGAPVRGEFRVFDTEVPTSEGPVLLALDGAGLRHLLVPVAPDFTPAHDRRSGGVHLVTRPLIDGSSQRQYIDLACQKLHLNSVFAHLADEVVGHLRTDSSRPLQTCRETLQRWRELLDREALNVLSTEALGGLFGELWHLRRIVNESPAAVSAWQGPDRRRHDFTTPGCALEVKTTSHRTQWIFHVHGLTQLAQPPQARLYFCGMRLELNGASGHTVPDLIKEILDSGADRRDLLSRLMEAGYDMRDDAHYGQVRFDVVELRTYEVTESFPRLTEASFGPAGLPTGIADVQYTINLAASSAAPLPPEALWRLHAALAGVGDAGSVGSAV